MYKHLIQIMATVRKWRGIICLAFLFRVSLHISGRIIFIYFYFFFAILLKNFFMVKSKKCNKYKKYVHLGQNTFIN